MESPLKPHQILSHWVPGLVVLLLLVMSRFNWDYSLFSKAIASQGSVASVSIILLGIVAFLFGEFIDGLRDGVFEWVWDRLNKIGWERLFSDSPEMQLKRDVYWTYYVLCHNFVIGILVCFLLNLSGILMLPARMPNSVFYWVAATTLVLANNARTLRGEIYKFTKAENTITQDTYDDGNENLPHFCVFTRIGRSAIHGVGVFAIRDIPKDTYIFYGDNSSVVWVKQQIVENIDPELKRLYSDFCIIKNGMYGCPDNFNNLNVGWYLNESKVHPNVRCDVDYNFFTLCSVKKGEELTVDYSTFSDEPETV